MNKILILLVLLPLSCLAEKDPCKKIKKTINKENGTVLYQSPELQHISVIRQINSLNRFELRIFFKDDRPHFDSYGVSVEFEDGTIVKDDSMKIDCREEMALVSGNGMNSSAQSRGYLLNGFVHIEADNMGLFMRLKIVKVQLHHVPQKITEKEASRVIEYVMCMKDIKE